MTKKTTPSPLATAAGLILLSEVFLVLSGFSIRQVSANLHTFEIVFLRNLIGFGLLLPWLIRSGLIAVQTEVLRFHFMRAAVGVAAMSCLYYAWGHLPLALAALLKQTAPFFTPVIALIWLGEKVTPLLKWSLLVGFLGVFLVLNPTEANLNLAVFIAIFGAMLAALTKVTVRRLAITEPAKRIVFYFSLFATLISAGPAFYYWITPSSTELIWLVLLAITSTLAQLFLSRGYSMAPAGQLGPFTYASIAFAALLGWWFWDETLDWNTLGGMMFIVFAGLMAMRPGPRT